MRFKTLHRNVKILKKKKKEAAIPSPWTIIHYFLLQCSWKIQNFDFAVTIL